jgi:hypothetical protein
MSPLHLSVSAINIACLVAALVGGTLGISQMLAAGIFFGYFANLLAVLTAAIVAILLLLRVRTGEARATFARSWLGLFNGAVVILAWAVFFAVGKWRVAGLAN